MTTWIPGSQTPSSSRAYLEVKGQASDGHAAGKLPAKVIIQGSYTVKLLCIPRVQLQGFKQGCVVALVVWVSVQQLPAHEIGV